MSADERFTRERPGSPNGAAALADRLQASADPAAHRLDLDVEGCRISVRTNEPALRDRLTRYFADWVIADTGDGPVDFLITALEAPTLELEVPWTVKRPEPGKTKIKEEWFDYADGRIVRKRTTGMLFVFGGPIHLAYGPCLANDNQIVNFVNNRYMQWRLSQGYVLAHAGAVARDGRCLALCGPSGAGKSTAALGLVGEGLDFVSNDRLLLRPDASTGSVEVQGIPKHPRVNPGTILHNPLLDGMIERDERQRLLGLGPDALRRLEQKYDVLIDETVGPGRFRLQGVLDALVVFNWTAEGEPEVRSIDLRGRPELLPLITKSPGLFYEPEEGQHVDLSDERFLETLSGARVVEITGRQDFDRARALCLDALGEVG